MSNGTKISRLSGVHYTNGSKTYFNAACLSADSDGKYFTHYYANGGNMKREITKKEYDDEVQRIKALNGTYSKVHELSILTFEEFIL